MKSGDSIKLQTVFDFDFLHVEHFVVKDKSHLSEQKNWQKIDFHHPGISKWHAVWFTDHVSSRAIIL